MSTTPLSCMARSSGQVANGSPSSKVRLKPDTTGELEPDITGELEPDTTGGLKPLAAEVVKMEDRQDAAHGRAEEKRRIAARCEVEHAAQGAATLREVHAGFHRRSTAVILLCARVLVGFDRPAVGNCAGRCSN